MGATAVDARRLIAGAVLAALGLLCAACAAGESNDDGTAGGTSVAAGPRDAEAEHDAAGGDRVEPGEGTRDDVDCSAQGLDDTGEFEFVSAHYVIDGTLGALCFGESSRTLDDAWGILVDIVPPEQLRDLALFGGFVGEEDQEEPTLAFVNSREDTDEFQMSVNLDEAELSNDEFALTMVHEFAHVFTGTPAELDRTVLPEECTTWDNGEGCYVPGSLMDEWTQQFWAGELDSVKTDAEPSAAEGQLRCDADAGFFGAYAASHPEEDFAESFAAWVLRVPADNDGRQQRYNFMEARPGLVEFRERAEAAGYGPQPDAFDECGLGG